MRYRVIVRKTMVKPVVVETPDGWSAADARTFVHKLAAGGWLEFAPDTGETVIGDAVELTKGEICATSYKASFDSDRWLGR